METVAKGSGEEEFGGKGTGGKGTREKEIGGEVIGGIGISGGRTGREEEERETGYFSPTVLCFTHQLAVMVCVATLIMHVQVGFFQSRACRIDNARATGLVEYLSNSIASAKPSLRPLQWPSG
jgi:hypothetical protein